MPISREPINLHWLGHPVTLLAIGEDNEEAFTVLLTRVSPAQGMKARIHFNEATAYYILSGVLQFFVGGRELTLTAGEFVFVPQGTAQKFHNPGSQSARIVIVCAPAGYDGFLLATGSPRSPEGTESAPITARELDRVKVLAHQYRLDLYPGPETFRESSGTNVPYGGTAKDSTGSGVQSGSLAEKAYASDRLALRELTIGAGGESTIDGSETDRRSLYVIEGNITAGTGQNAISATEGALLNFGKQASLKVSHDSGEKARVLLLTFPDQPRSA